MEILFDYTRRYGVEIWGYCLLTTPVHLVAVPEREDSLGLAVGRAHRKYARHAHRRQRWWGHPWANRFYSTMLDEAHCWTALKYSEGKPKRAGLVEIPGSTRGVVRARMLLGDPHPVLTPCPLGAWLTAAEEVTAFTTLRANTYTGWPTGSPEFVAQLEAQLGRRLSREPAGWKRKETGNT